MQHCYPGPRSVCRCCSGRRWCGSRARRRWRRFPERSQIGDLRELRAGSMEGDYGAVHLDRLSRAKIECALRGGIATPPSDHPGPDPPADGRRVPGGTSASAVAEGHPVLRRSDRAARSCPRHPTRSVPVLTKGALPRNWGSTTTISARRCGGRGLRWRSSSRCAAGRCRARSRYIVPRLVRLPAAIDITSPVSVAGLETKQRPERLPPATWKKPGAKVEEEEGPRRLPRRPLRGCRCCGSDHRPSRSGDRPSGSDWRR